MLPAADITVIRTAAASAVATDALARAESSRLVVLGTGEQAEAHVLAICGVRPIRSVVIWGRTPANANALAARLAHALGQRASSGMAPSISVTTASSVQSAVAEADIICTTTAASEPILFGKWIAPGTHINVVGSSRAGPAEIDNDLVVRSRFFADQRESVLKQGAEFVHARDAGLITDAHLLAEIGEVLSGYQALTSGDELGGEVVDMGAAEGTLTPLGRRMVRRPPL